MNADIVWHREVTLKFINGFLDLSGDEGEAIITVNERPV